MWKNKIRKQFVLVVVIVLMLMVFASCASNNQPGDDKLIVRVGFFPNITHSQALVGRADGTFQKKLGETNVIEWKQFNAGPAEIEALFAGEIDIGYIGSGPAINGFVKSNGELQIVSGAADAGAIFVSRKGLIIKDLKELSGKKIAVPQIGNTQDLSLRNLLYENGLKDTTKGGTVEIVQAENPDIKTLLDSEQVDAAFVPEPWGSRLVKEIGANIILDYKDVFRDGKYATAVVIARTQFIKDHPDVIERFVRAHVELTESVNKDLEKYKVIVNDQIKELTQKAIDKDVLDSAFNRLTITYDPEKLSIQDFANLSLKAGFVKEAPDLTNLYNLTFLNKILKEKGFEEIK